MVLAAAAAAQRKEKKKSGGQEKKKKKLKVSESPQEHQNISPLNNASAVSTTGGGWEKRAKGRVGEREQVRKEKPWKRREKERER